MEVAHSYISLVIPYDKNCPDFKSVAKEVSKLNPVLQRKNLPRFNELIFVIRKKDFRKEVEKNLVMQNLTLRFIRGGDEQHSSIFTGISHAKGDLIAVMDCDHHPRFFLHIIESMMKLTHEEENKGKRNSGDDNNDDFAFIGLIPEKKQKFRSRKKNIRFVGTLAFYSVLKLVILLSLITEIFFLAGDLIRIGRSYPGLYKRRREIFFLLRLLHSVDRITTFSVISKRRVKKIREAMEKKGRKYSNYLVAVMKAGNTFLVELPSFVESMKPKRSGYSIFQLIRLATSTFIDVLLG